MSRIRTEEFIKQLELKLRNYTAESTGKYSAGLYPYTCLFSPVSFGGITLKNRVIQECAGDALNAVRGGAGLIVAPIEYDRSLDAMSHWFKVQDEAHTRKAFVFAEVIAEQDKSSPIAAMLESGAMLKEMTAFAEEVVFQKWDGVYFIDRMEDGFSLKLIRRLRAVVGAGLPIIYRISISSKRSIAETADYMLELIAAGVDMFVTDFGFEEYMQSITMPAGCYTDISAYFKEYFCAINVNVPVAAVGRLEYPDVAEKALRDGKCDLVLLENADANWCTKAQSGRCSEIVSPYCSGLSGNMLPKAEKAKKIAVSGSGAEGLNFALFAAARGYKVEIFESRDEIGGRLNTESAMLEMYELRNYADRLKAQVRACDNITVRTGTRAVPELIGHEGFDTMVYAVDSAPVSKLNIPGWGEIPSVSVHDIMANPLLLNGARHVTVLGSNDTALICARYLRNELGVKKVSVFSETCSGEKRLCRCLEKSGVKLVWGANASKIVNGSVFADVSCGKKSDVISSRSELIVMALEEKGRIYEQTSMDTRSFGPCAAPAEAEMTAFSLAKMI